MFYIIGLGLSDEKDITLRGLEVKMPEKAHFGTSLDLFFSHQAIRSSSRLYLEAYTSILTVRKERLVRHLSDLSVSSISPSLP